MAQLVSVRSNQNFSVNHQKGNLIAQTEIIVLVEKPKYVLKGDNIQRSSEVTELRFNCGSEALNHLIGQLQMAQRNVTHYEQMAGALNNIISNSKPPEGEVVAK